MRPLVPSDGAMTNTPSSLFSHPDARSLKYSHLLPFPLLPLPSLASSSLPVDPLSLRPASSSTRRTIPHPTPDARRLPAIMSAAPLKRTRLASLAMSFAFGIIGMGVGINALVKFENEKHTLKKMAPSAATVTIDTTDILASGIVLTIVCGLVALASLLFLLPALLASASAHRWLKLQTAVFGFLSVWAFAVLVPFTDFFANRQAKVSASIGNIQLPASIIQQLQNQIGATPVYRHVRYRMSSSSRPALSCDPHVLTMTVQCACPR